MGHTSVNKMSRIAATATFLCLLAGLSGADLRAQTGMQFVGTITTVAGTPGKSGYTGDNGPALSALLNSPATATYDAKGNLYIADTGNNVIRRVDAVTDVITTVAGTGVPGWASGSGPALSMALNKPLQVAFDASGNMYIADNANCAVREVTQVGTPNATLLTYAGAGPQVTPASAANTSTAPCPAALSGTATVGASPLTAVIQSPNAIAIDFNGYIYWNSSQSNRIQRVSNGLVYIYAGSGGSTYPTGDGGAAQSARLGRTLDIAFDRQNNLYVTDNYNSLVRVIAQTSTKASGTVTEFAGVFDNPNNATSVTPNTGDAGDGGSPTAATLNYPTGIYVDPAGNVYISDSGNSRVRVVSATTKTINAFAGNAVGGTTTSGYSGDGGPAFYAELGGGTSTIYNMGLSGSAGGDRIAITDTKNNVVRVVAIANSFSGIAIGSTSAAQTISAQAINAGTITAFAVGASTTEFTVGQFSGCPGPIAALGACTAQAQFSPAVPGLRTAPLSITDSTGAVTTIGLSGIGIAAGANFAPGNISAFAGTGSAGYGGDGAAAAAALLNAPSGVAIDPSGNVYVADTANNRVRLISSSTGTISTVAGTGMAGFSGDGSAATGAQLNLPGGVALDPAGNLYIADTGNNRVRKVNVSTGTISTVAGGTTAGNTGDFGLATSALLNGPIAVASDQHGSVFIADTGNNRIREISAYGGTMVPVAGSGTAGYSTDGTAPLAASLRSPSGIFVDTANNVYFSDTGNNLVREITAADALTTLAGASTTAGFAGDGGLATSASLSGPLGLAVDPAGDVYIADAGNNRVREINVASGVINTIAGNGGLSLAASGTLSTLSGLNAPRAIALDKNGNLFIAASGDNQVANITTASISVAFGTVARGSAAPTQTIALQNFGNAPLTLSGLALSSQSSFSLFTGQASDCTAATILAPGSTCNLRIGFTPAAGGPTTATITATDNSFANAASTQVVTLIGTGVVVPSVITIIAGNNQTAHPLGQFSTLTVKVTDSGGYAANGAAATFSVPVQTGTAAGGMFVGGTTAGSTNTITVTTASDGTASATLLAGVNTGSFTVTATVPGVTTAATFMETIAGNVAPVITISVPASALTYGQTATLNATLTPATVGANTATGKVTFFDNGTAITSASCTGTITNGTVAACSYIPLAGTHAITAAYSGDNNFSSSSTSTASNFVVNPLAITATTSSVSIVYGSTVPSISGTLTGILPQDAGNVGVSFAPVGAKTIPDVAVYPLTPTLSGSAAANYTVTASGSPTLTVTQAKSTTALVVSPVSGYLNYTTISFIVTVAPATSGSPQPTGIVTVIATPATGSAVVLGPFPIVNGIATASSTTLPAGVYSTTAAYSGSTDYASSTSSATQLTITGPTFALTVNQPSLTLPQGTAAYVNVTLQPNLIFNSTVTLACTNLPTNTACSFFPATLTNSSPSAGVNIATSGPQTSLLRGSPLDKHLAAYAAGFYFANLLIFGFYPNRRRRVTSFLGLLLVSILAGAISGCSSGVSNPSTPTGSFTIMITGTATVGGTIITSSVPITLVVTTGNPLK